MQEYTITLQKISRIKIFSAMNKKNKFRLIQHLIVFISVSMVLPSVCAAQTEEMLSRQYATGSFTGLFLDGSFGVQLIQGDEESLEVRAYDIRAFESLNISNEEGLLHLNVTRKLFDFSKVMIFVTFKELNQLHVLGGVKLDTNGFLDLKNLNILLEGGAKVDLQLKAKNINLENRGGLLCEMSGVADVLNARLAGAGHINAGELKAKDVNFRIEGVGTARVFATDNLNASIKGAGKIRYRGNPEVVQSVEGLGSIVQE